MGVLSSLEPKVVFDYFEQICGIPHGSSNTKQISDYLVDFAKDRNLWYRQDELGNVIIKKPGTAGYEQSSPVIIQGHIDMVCEKDADCSIDFTKDGLDLVIDDNFVYAKGTTLGGDDGIAVAFALAILDDKESIAHPPIEAVFTVDEEIGLLGAAGLDCSDLEGKYFLNLDSEEEGHLLVSCAGGATVDIDLPIAYEDEANWYTAEIAVVGATGGHSGVEIIKQGANASKVLGNILVSLDAALDFRIVSITGGKKDNVIPKDSSVKIAFSAKETLDEIMPLLQQFSAIIKEEYQLSDPDIKITLASCKQEMVSVMTKDSSERMEQILMMVPNGIVRMSADIEGLVQTSLNLGILETVAGENSHVNYGFSVRSSVGTEKEMLIEQLQSIGKMFGADVSVQGEYPAWEYKKDSKLRSLMVQIYKDMYGEEPVVEAIHAGLECGLFSDKIKDLDCVSYGPWIYDIHTAKERLQIDSVKRTWEYTLEVLKNLK